MTHEKKKTNTVNSQQSTVNSQQSTVNSQQSTVNSSQVPVGGRMAAHENDMHVKQVDIWIKKNIDGLPLEKQALLFVSAFHSLEASTLRTLSSIILMVILDRVLRESVEKFPLLSEVKITSSSLSFEALLSNYKKHKPDELFKALRYIIVNLLSVLGSITANILTTTLYLELHNVTSESMAKNIREEK